MLAIHAVFISVPPKLPSWNLRHYPPALPRGYNVYGHQEFSGYNLTFLFGTRTVVVRADTGQQGVSSLRPAGVSAGRQSESACLFYRHRTQFKLRTTPRNGVQTSKKEWSPNAPPIWRKLNYEQPHSTRTASGLGTCYAGFCADHLAVFLDGHVISARRHAESARVI